MRKGTTQKCFRCGREEKNCDNILYLCSICIMQDADSVAINGVSLVREKAVAEKMALRASRIKAKPQDMQGYVQEVKIEPEPNTLQI